MRVQIHPYYFSTQKRLFDLILFFIVVAPVTIIALIILITQFFLTKKNSLYIQKRVGKNGLIFSMIKIRTMYMYAHQDKQKYFHLNQAPYPFFKIFADPRFVGIGRWLSKTGLDEVLQIFNIFAGHMSFIGPRPLPLEEDSQLPLMWSFRKRVKPGMFSYWTLSNQRHSSLKVWILLEIKTVSKASAFSDITLIAQTVYKQMQKVIS